MQYISTKKTYAKEPRQNYHTLDLHVSMRQTMPITNTATQLYANNKIDATELNLKIKTQTLKRLQ